MRHHLLHAALLLAILPACSNSDGTEIVGKGKTDSQRYLTVKIDGNCAATEKSITLYVDGRSFGLVDAGQNAMTVIDTGRHAISAVSSKGRKWAIDRHIYRDTVVLFGCR